MSSMLLKTGGLDNMHSQTSDGVGWGRGHCRWGQVHAQKQFISG